MDVKAFALKFNSQPDVYLSDLRSTLAESDFGGLLVHLQLCVRIC